MEPLNVSVENLGKLKRKLQVTVPKEAVQETYNKSYNSLEGKINIPGFRKGHIPQTLMEKRFKKHMSQEASETLVPEYFEKALKQENLELVGRPHFSDLDVDKKKPLVFSVMFEVKPEFEAPDYKSFKLEKKEIEVTQEDIDKRGKFHLERAATYQTTDEAFTADDQVVLDYKAEPENENIPPKENFRYKLGSKELDPEVDEALIGMKAGEEKTIEVKFADDHANKELQGTISNMLLKVTEVLKRNLPELNEVFFSQYNDIKTEEDFANFLKDEATEMKRHEYKAEYRKSIKEQLAEKLDFELPEEILAEEIYYREKQAKQTNSDESKSDKDIKAEIEKSAKEEIRFSFYVQKILESEKKTVDKNEVDQRFQLNCMMMGVNPSDFIKQEYGRQIYQQTHGVIAEENVLDFVTDKIFE